VLYLPGHHSAGYTFATKSFNQPGELAERKPVNHSCSTRLNLREGLFFDGGDDNFKTLSPSGVEHQEREAAVAGNEAQFQRNFLPFLRPRRIDPPGCGASARVCFT